MTTDIFQFGQGEAVVSLTQRPSAEFELPDQITDQYYEINTENLTISHILVRDIDPDVDTEFLIEESRPYLLTRNGLQDGVPVGNPGFLFGEFHFASFAIEATVSPDPDEGPLAAPVVRVIGENPLVMRCSGLVLGELGKPDDVVFDIRGLIDLDGNPGGDGTLIGGAGGEGTAGGGDGGDGALMTIGFGGGIGLLEPALSGANSGGGAGVTPAAVNPLATRNSTSAGSPGGGGGHRTRGGDGDLGTATTINNFNLPRVGRGGVVRGTSLCVPLTTGSGGGGGGASLSRSAVAQGGTYAVNGGAGGGGGGGATKVTVRGSAFIIGDGRISANGGEGGSGTTETASVTGGGAGGGGSGGSIYFRTTGSIVLDSCDKLQVNGGEAGRGGAGSTNAQNLRGGSGDGSDGYVRLESGIGGTPYCGIPLEVPSTTLRRALSRNQVRRQKIEVVANGTAAFPASGFVKIDNEVIRYTGTTLGGLASFDLLNRAVEGSIPGAPGDDCNDLSCAHAIGAQVIFYPITIEPVTGPSDPAIGDDAERNDDVATGGDVDILFGGGIIPSAGPDLLGGGVNGDEPDGELDPWLPLIETNTNSGVDGVLHLYFIEGLDPATGQVRVDEITGRPVSVWSFDTESGELRSPLGNVVKRVRSAITGGGDGGFMDLQVLIIDEDVILRATGPTRLTISVLDYAEIGGAIDVSGLVGGALRFTRGGQLPQSGLGGGAGAGGGDGGAGGMVVFNGSVNGVGGVGLDNHAAGNHNAANTPSAEQFNGAAAPFPFLLEQFNLIPNGFALMGLDPDTSGPQGGTTLPCRANPFPFAGGGGGGGNLAGGYRADSNGTAGVGGTAIFFENQRISETDLALVGGFGGGGGGASAEVSSDYSSRNISGQYPFKGQALYAPGTGGGGGGGVVHILARDLYLRQRGRIIARGGDAYQSIDVGGNGGAGAGGTIFLQFQNTITLEPGCQFDVRAGQPNRLPPFFSGSSRLYEGNVRDGTVPSESGTLHGGMGGNGSNGRIRIEYSPSANLQQFAGGGAPGPGDMNISMTTGPFLKNIVESSAVSKIFRLGVGPGHAASTDALLLDSARVVFNAFQQPTGTRAIVTWESAGDSLDVHGQPDELKGIVRDPTQLEGTKYVRFRVYFLSTYAPSRATQAIQDLSLPFRLEEVDCLGF